MNKKQTSIRLTKEAQELIEKLVKKSGLTQTTIIEIAIRQYAKNEGVK